MVTPIRYAAHDGCIAHNYWQCFLFELSSPHQSVVHPLHSPEELFALKTMHHTAAATQRLATRDRVSSSFAIASMNAGPKKTPLLATMSYAKAFYYTKLHSWCAELVVS